MLIDLFPDPVQMVHHVGVHARLPSLAAALRFSERDDAENNFSAAEVVSGETSPAVPVTTVRNLVPAGDDDLGAGSTELGPRHLPPVSAGV